MATAQEQVLIDAARKSFKSLKKRDSWEDWANVIKGLKVGRDYAMEEAGLTPGVDKPTGKKYGKAFSQWLHDHELNEGTGGPYKTTRAACLRCADELPEIIKYRIAVCNERPEVALTLNHPQKVWSAYNATKQKPSRKSKPLEAKHRAWLGDMDPRDLLGVLIEECDGEKLAQFTDALVAHSGKESKMAEANEYRSRHRAEQWWAAVIAEMPDADSPPSDALSKDEEQKFHSDSLAESEPPEPISPAALARTDTVVAGPLDAEPPEPAPPEPEPPASAAPEPAPASAPCPTEPQESEQELVTSQQDWPNAPGSASNETAGGVWQPTPSSDVVLNPKTIESKTDSGARSSAPSQAATADDWDRAAALLGTPLSKLDLPLVETGAGFARLRGDPLLVEAAGLIRRKAFAVLAKLTELRVEVAEDTITYLRRLPSASFWVEHKDSTMTFILQAVQGVRRTKSTAC